MTNMHLDLCCKFLSKPDALCVVNIMYSVETYVACAARVIESRKYIAEHIYAIQK